MCDIFEEEETEAILLVDANNAFNSINREAMLHNISIKCPTISQYTKNTYGTPTNLYIDGGRKDADIIKSEEGTTQGDPISMAMCRRWRNSKQKLRQCCDISLFTKSLCYLYVSWHLPESDKGVKDRCGG